MKHDRALTRAAGAFNDGDAEALLSSEAFGTTLKIKTSYSN